MNRNTKANAIQTKDLDRLLLYGQEEFAHQGKLLFQQGDTMLDLLVVLEGRLEVFEERSGGLPRVVQSLSDGNFTGELDLLNARRSLLSCRAARRTRILRISRERFRELLRAEGDLAERIVVECISRRAALLEHGSCGGIVVGAPRTGDTLRVLQFLIRTGSPYRFVNVEENDSAGVLLEMLECSNTDLPIVFLKNERLLRNPSNRRLAELLGLAGGPTSSRDCDLAVIGAGPAGLAAAVYSASEGLRTVVIECHTAGGQAGSSSRIENYLGFATGISGQELASNAEIQAQRFGAELLLAQPATGLTLDETTHQVILGDGSTIRARAIVIATGARYRQLSIPGGNGVRSNVEVHYAATPLEAIRCLGQDVLVIGGGNSAGQAALFLAKHAVHVHLVVRRNNLAETMSDYLVQRLLSSDRITLHLEAVLCSVEETARGPIAVIEYASAGTREKFSVHNLFVMIGAEPNTEWLQGTLALDKSGFIVTGDKLPSSSSNFETSSPGVFAIGDVRSGSLKRVASAAGEGAAVIADIHRYLARAGVIEER